MNQGQQKKADQLGMNPGTASGRLVKDLLWSLIDKKCYRCGKEMTRETFSIDHVVPWLDSEDPLGLYFDLHNVSFSHRFCNVSASRTPHKVYDDPLEGQRVYSRRHYHRHKNRINKERRRKNRRRRIQTRLNKLAGVAEWKTRQAYPSSWTALSRWCERYHRKEVD